MTFNATLDSIKTYEAGKPIELVVRDFGIDKKDIIKLASNENAFGPSQKAIDAIIENATNAHLYPDDSMFALKEKLAQKFSVQENEIIIGSGSDQIIEFCIHAKANKTSKVLMAKTTFAMYEVYSKSVGATIIKTKSDTHNLEQFLEEYNTHKPEIVFLCLPNNPLGECLDSQEVYGFLEKIDKNTLVIIDGAYQEYAKTKDIKKEINPKELINTFNNAVYLGTFSKAYGLGGMRVGYGIAKKEIIDALLKLRPPFNITTPSLASAIAALSDESHIEMSIKNNLEQMQKYEDFAKEKGFDFIPSYTNFITYLFDDNLDSTNLADFLLQKGMIIRNLQSYGLNAIRITIGKPDENQRFFDLFSEYLSK